MPLNVKMFRATRSEVPVEMDLPEIGALVTSFLDPTTYASHYIVDVGDGPRGNKRSVWVDFMAVPADFTDYEPYGYVFPPIYPNSGLTNFPGGAQARALTVPAEVLYEFHHGDAPKAAWLSAAVRAQDKTTGPFEPKSYIAEAAAQTYDGTDGNSYRIGMWLAGSFLAQNTINNSIGLSLQDPHSIAYTVPASDPTATAYDGWVSNKERFIAERTISRFAGKMWMRRTVKIVAQ